MQSAVRSTAASAPARPSPQALLLYLAGQIDPDLLTDHNEQPALKPPVTCTANELGAIDQRLTSSQRRELAQLLSLLSGEE